MMTMKPRSSKTTRSSKGDLPWLEEIRPSDQHLVIDGRQRIKAYLTDRWTFLRYHEIQRSYWTSPHRFNVMPAGRRSGKTELFKRKVVKRALRGTRFYPARFFAAAPTQLQAKRIFWDDLKALIPERFVLDKSEGELWIKTPLSEIHVLGMDRPERIEGSPWDGGGLDEFANMRAKTFPNHVRPALADRGGWCDLFGVPEGRNHYYDTCMMALAEMQERGPESEWGYFHWTSATVLPASEIERLRTELDTLTFQQELEASFVNFTGRAYHAFLVSDHVRSIRERYDPNAPLIISFDFNVDPGVAVIGQEMRLPNDEIGTGWIGEVHIPVNSNTLAVCRRLALDWGQHRGLVYVHGDATGGARKTSGVLGNDWDLVRTSLGRVWMDERNGSSRMHLRTPTSNPSERQRINAVNSRLRSDAGNVRMMVDGKHCPNLVKDLEGVRVLEGGSGEIDKKKDPTLSHISDAVGYYVHREHPTSGAGGSNFGFRI